MNFKLSLLMPIQTNCPLLDGNTVSIPTGGTDADADPTNELQELTLQGTFLGLRDGNEVDLAKFSSPWTEANNVVSYDGEARLNNAQKPNEFVRIRPFEVAMEDEDGFESFWRAGDMAFNEKNNTSTFLSYGIDVALMTFPNRQVEMGDMGFIARHDGFFSNLDEEGLIIENSSQGFRDFFGVSSNGFSFFNATPTDTSIIGLNYFEGFSMENSGRGIFIGSDGLAVRNQSPIAMDLNINALDMRQESNQGGQNSIMTLCKDSLTFYSQFALLFPAVSSLSGSALKFEDGPSNSTNTSFFSEFEDEFCRSQRTSSEYTITQIFESGTGADRFKLNKDNLQFLGPVGFQTAHLGSLSNSISGFLELYDGTGFRTLTAGSSILNNSEGSLVLYGENDPIIDFTVRNGAALMSTYNVNSTFTMHDNIGTEANQLRVNDVGLGEIWSNYHIYIKDELTGFPQGGIMSDQVYTYGQFNLWELDPLTEVSHLRGRWYTGSNGGNLPEMNAGNMELYGPNGNRNVWLSSVLDGNEGYIGVIDETDVIRAEMFTLGQVGFINTDILNATTVNATTVNTFIDHPTKSNKEIVYSAVIGSEPMAITRGTAKLANGTIFVELPLHFQYVNDMSTMTVVLTPHSGDTYGLAVVKKKENGFYVKELAKGQGNFSFDWEVKATRKGFENHQVIREKRIQNAKPANLTANTVLVNLTK